jgi:hypothetical protein
LGLGDLAAGGGFFAAPLRTFTSTISPPSKSWGRRQWAANQTQPAAHLHSALGEALPDFKALWRSTHRRPSVRIPPGPRAFRPNSKRRRRTCWRYLAISRRYHAN